MAVLGKYEQKNSETLDYDIDYTDFYEGRTDAPHATTPLTITVPSGVTLTGSSMNGKLAKIILTAVVAGATYVIHVLHTTTTGIVKHDEFLVVGK